MDLKKIKAQEETLNLELLKTKAEEASEAGIQWAVEPAIILGLVKAVMFWRDEFKWAEAEAERLRAELARLNERVERERNY